MPDSVGFLLQGVGVNGDTAKPSGQDAFAFLMQQARQGQSKAASNTRVPEKPADALSLLMQQARAGHAGTAPAASTSRCVCDPTAAVMHCMT